jgi:hypothetical protein
MSVCPNVISLFYAGLTEKVFSSISYSSSFFMASVATHLILAALSFFIGDSASAY